VTICFFHGSFSSILTLVKHHGDERKAGRGVGDKASAGAGLEVWPASGSVLASALSPLGAKKVSIFSMGCLILTDD
jgi:hypothetical protein